MTFTPQNPKDALSKGDMLAMGVDAARHPLLGCVISQAGSPPNEQARNFLRSLFNDGQGQITEDEFKHWWRELVKWEATNSVKMPPPAHSADRAPLPVVTPHNPSEEEKAQTARILADQKARQRAANDAIELTRNPGPFLDAVKSQEAAGQRPPGSYLQFATKVWNEAPEVAKTLKLPQPPTKH